MEHRQTTEHWAKSLNIPTAIIPPTIAGYEEPCALSARDIAIRALILQGVVAVASGVEATPVVEWFRDQGIADGMGPREQSFFDNPHALNSELLNRLRWQREAEWALLWVVGKVDCLGLPTRQCDTRRLIDDIVPGLGQDIEPFLAASAVRPPGDLLAEEDRHYDMWCYYVKARPMGPKAVPSDLLPDVLYQREYAFEWLHGIEAWDDVRCDA